MCQACGGTCGTTRDRRRSLTLDIRVSGRTLRLRDAGGPAPLYVSRTLDPDCAETLRGWARAAGLADVMAPEAMHVTVAYSRAPVDWFRFASWYAADRLHLPAGGPRRVETFKDGAIVLRLASDVLARRWEEFRAGGCSWDFPTYAPHVTIARGPGSADLPRLKAYAGALDFGPEEFAPIAA